MYNNSVAGLHMRDSHAQKTLADTRYNVGVKSLDAQHQTILETLDRLFTTVESNKGPEAVMPILNDFLSHTRQHFSNEEELLTRTDYPSLLTHKSAHDVYLNKILIYQKNVADGNVSFAIERVSFFRRWFKDHILETDKLYIPFMANKDFV